MRFLFFRGCFRGLPVGVDNVGVGHRRRGLMERARNVEVDLLPKALSGRERGIQREIPNVQFIPVLNKTCPSR